MSTSRKTNRTTVYIEPQELYDEVKKYRDAVQLDPEAAQPSEKLGRLFVQLAENVLSSKSFNRYSPHEKQDMKSEALYRLMRALSRADLSQGPKKVWSYMTRTVFCSYLGFLSRKYRDVERRFKLAHDALAAQGCSEAKIEQLLGRKSGEKLSFGIARSRWYVYGYKTEAQRKAEAEAAQQAADASQQPALSSDLEKAQQKQPRTRRKKKGKTC